MNTVCPICCEELGPARAVTECGHAFCTRCLLNSVALNVGTEEGSTRNQCPMCRKELCEEIKPSAIISIRIENLVEDYNQITEECVQVIEECEAVRTDYENAASAETDLKIEAKCLKNTIQELSLKLDETQFQKQLLKLQVRDNSRAIETLRKDIAYLKYNPTNKKYNKNTIAIQMWWRCIQSKKKINILKQQKYWNLYKNTFKIKSTKSGLKERHHQISNRTKNIRRKLFERE
tara:strand:- start:39 stop:740 length:702 start_codon:yes stop_codon:yes gene_type:complete